VSAAVLGATNAYSWLLLAGIALSLIFWWRLARRDDRLLLIYLAALLGAFLGAKIVYLLAEGWRDFGQPDQWRRLATGKTVLGALLFGYGSVELAKKFVGYRQVTGDWFALIAPAGIALGRVGCLLHGCCLGEVCEHASWWTLNDVTGTPRWPAVPIEIAFNLAALGGVWWLRRRSLLTGQHFHLYLIAYGSFRFVHEFFRDTPRVLGPITGYQMAALALVILGVWRFRQRAASNHLECGGSPSL
jgi:phosphatidylglycerol:prolipoprotein diacylglycerol transferase